MRIAIWLAALSLVVWSVGANAQSELKGLASVSGTVSSSAPFKAAKVYFRNTERRMQYMVYTAGGKYQAMNLLPGNYEMRVDANGLEAAVTRVALKEGQNPPVDATLRENKDDAQIVTLDEMFPPGPGQEYVRNTCIGCHNPNMFGARQMPAAAWDQYVEMMLKNGAIPRGFSSPQERADLVAYLGKHFGPDAKKRAIRFVKEVPLDEAKLAKAMYIEYYLLPIRKMRRADRSGAEAARAGPALRPRRQRLGHRPQRAQPPGEARSAHRRVEGLADAASAGRDCTASPSTAKAWSGFPGASASARTRTACTSRRSIRAPRNGSSSRSTRTAR